MYTLSESLPRAEAVAVVGDRIAAVGTNDVVEAWIGPQTRVIDAEGMTITPGFIETHTHFDGAMWWDPALDPLSGYGVTSVVMGNCGVGFAPVRPGAQGELIELMEGVEDIPGSALSEGIRWDWQSFPEYLDALDKLHSFLPGRRLLAGRRGP